MLKATLSTVLILLVFSCDTIELDYSITEKLNQQDYVQAIKYQFTTWNQLILFGNYSEAGDMCYAGSDFQSIASNIQIIDTTYGVRWFYQFDTVQVIALQYNNTNAVRGAWITGTYKYMEGYSRNYTNNTQVTANTFYATAVLTQQTKDFVCVELSHFAKGEFYQYWWLNNTGNELPASEYRIELID